MSAPVAESESRAGGFFVAGGTLRADAPSYVPRSADSDLFRALTEGQFCYVLNARQMGKSSLMVQTTAKLRAQGLKVAVLDLTSIGRNVSLEQWYFGLLTALGSQLGQRRPLMDSWGKDGRFGPLQRWFEAIDKVVLRESDDSLVIFIDEIDYVRSLPFQTDEFFAAIRDSYNRRSTDPAYKRITFCLLGVASPAELIADARMTPFNIGSRIELSDFTLEDARPLAEGLGKGQTGLKMLERVLYWTGGHPYLTQRLCSALVHEGACDVDKMCESLFLNEKARTIEDNFAFVRHRLLNSSEESSEVLDVYGQILKGKRVGDEEANPIVSLLKLSGVVRSSGGTLHVRNRIYRRIFDRAWIQCNLPEAEVRRARRSFWRGLTLAGGVAVLVTAVIGSIAYNAVSLQHQAEQSASVALIESRRVAEERETLRRQIYAARMRFADLDYRSQQLGEARDILESLKPASGQPDYRGFEWYRLMRLTESPSALTLSSLSDRPNAVVVTPDGKRVFSGGQDSTLTVWDLPDLASKTTVPLSQPLTSLAMSKDGKTLAVGLVSGLIRFLDARDLTERSALDSGSPQPTGLAFVDSKRFLSLGVQGRMVLWDLPSHKKLTEMVLEPPATHLALAPDASRVAVSSLGRTLHMALISIGDRKLTLISSLPQSGGGGISFNDDGSKLVFGSSAGQVFLADGKTGKVDRKLELGRSGITAASPLGTRKVFLGTSGREAYLVDLATGSQRVISAHPEGILASHIADEGTLVTAGSEGSVRVWKDPKPVDEPMLAEAYQRIRTLRFSSDGKRLASAESDGRIILRDFPSGKVRWETKLHGNGAEPMDFDPKGRFIAALSLDGYVALLGTEDGKVTTRIPANSAQSIEFAPDGGKLLVLETNGVAHIYDTAEWKPFADFETSANGVAATDAAWNPNSDYIAISSSNKGLFLYSLINRTVKPLDKDDHYSSVAFAPDGESVAGGLMSGHVRFLDLFVSTKKNAEGAAGGAVLDLAFSPDGKTLAATGEGGAIYLWNAASQNLVCTIQADKVLTRTLAFSPDGKHLVSGGTDQILRHFRG